MTLELVPVDALIAELSRRYHSFVFAGLKDLNAAREGRRWHIQGSRFAALGMLEDLKLKTLEEIRQQESQEED